LEIRTQKELEAVIAKEKDAILKDKALRSKFDEIAKMLEKNVTLRDFQRYMLDHEAFLSQLSNINRFKQDVWKSYIKAKYGLYLDLVSKHESAQKRQKAIEDEAAKQRTQWEEVIHIFNDRFFVPFKLEVKNRIAVMLGNDSIIDLGFTYHDGNDNVSVAKDELLKCLSTGEKRALYILNVIFEIEVRKKANQETLMIIDDIADSFDYQNKYAIIQYLKDIHDDLHFKQIIMTHNFDFFRTVQSRFVQYSHCLMASKSSTGIALDKASGIKNIFVNDWKKEFFTDDKKRVASIPFLRNLVEYTKGEGDPKFDKLTSLLHCKMGSASITNADLDAIFNDICGSTDVSANGKKPVVDVIKDAGTSCLKTNSDTFESKIVLAVAIRLTAESFMIAKINDPVFLASIVAHQTQELFIRFKSQFPTETKAIEVLDRVQIMTPENIHLNSFMYEPIVDMSGDHLRKLYADALAL
jgi:ABC-type lipoprotein export system ATPase subunit